MGYQPILLMRFKLFNNCSMTVPLSATVSAVYTSRVTKPPFFDEDAFIITILTTIFSMLWNQPVSCKYSKFAFCRPKLAENMSLRKSNSSRKLKPSEGKLRSTKIINHGLFKENIRRQ